MLWADHFIPTLQVGSLSHREANYLVQDAFAETCRSQGGTWVFRGQLLRVALAEAAWIYTVFTSLTEPTPPKESALVFASAHHKRTRFFLRSKDRRERK